MLQQHITNKSTKRKKPTKNIKEIWKDTLALCNKLQNKCNMCEWWMQQQSQHILVWLCFIVFECVGVVVVIVIVVFVNK